MPTANENAVSSTRPIWIDLDNSPNVQFFEPIIKALRTRGYPILLTGRDCAQVRELVELFNMDCRIIGRHFGKNTLMKFAGLGVRAAQLAPTLLGARPP